MIDATVNHAGRSQVSRADLMRALAVDEPLRDQLADLIGFERILRPTGDKASHQSHPLSRTQISPSLPAYSDEESKVSGATRFVPQPFRFWCAESFKLHAPVAQESIENSRNTGVTKYPFRVATPRALFEPLVPLSDLLARLRRLAEFERPGGELDVDGLVHEFSRGRIPAEVPRQPKRSWGAGLHVVQDLSSRLTPYRIDQGLISRELKDLLPKSALTVSSIREGDLRPLIHWPDELFAEPEQFGAGSTVLVLGDLGVLYSTSTDLVQKWCAFGELLAGRQIHRAALVPCDVSRIPDELSRLWSILPWDRSRHSAGNLSAEELNQKADRLLALLSFAVTIEPGLLRRVRRAIPEFRQLGELESLVWQHKAIRGAGLGGIMLDREQRGGLELLRQHQPEQQRKLAVEYLNSEHINDYDGVRFAEILNLGDEARQFYSEDEIQAAKDWYIAIDRELTQQSDEVRGRIEFFRVVASHLSRRARKLVPALDRNWDRYCSEDPDAIPPLDFDPAGLTASHGDERLVHIRQSHSSLIIALNPESGAAGGSHLGLIRTRGDRIRIDALANEYEGPAFDIDRDFWADGQPPGWADRWGIDEFGPWVEFRVLPAVAVGKATRKKSKSKSESTAPAQAVVQRMRWVPAGTFLMGSPEDEPGRYGDEGPRHQVTISRGFWMFDTPTTQALWEAVTGQNPSRFKTPTRPVETVSWKDCQSFLKRLREVLPEIEVDLPWEAEWEFSCRAGTKTASYKGPVEILGAHNAPALDPIAWYGGNSGVDFELKNGIDASGWQDKQYEFKKAGTLPVALKTPNSLGLYDMLGNVLEWCADGKREYSGEAVEDPRGAEDASAERVFRGGSWGNDARDVRAAFRALAPPGYRYYYIGFRCRVLSCEPSQQAAEQARRTERAVSGRSRKAEPGGDSSPASGVRSAGRGHSGTVGTEPLMGQRFLDALARIPLERLPRPAWACAIDRDEFGLYADFEVPGEKKRSPVRQRLRLIPPGSFLMGSPDGEAGRSSDEGPQHQVTITRAIWMFDAPATQALWEAVTGKKPSHFKGGDRPVESVSWNDCQEFKNQVRQLLAGLELDLPTEAEWEYACRANTLTATYGGDLTIENERAKELEPIAWYWDNSGRETHAVRGKRPNAWGLYDTLGNVWEWCRDGKREYGNGEEVDPVGPEGASAERVIRGGSWLDDARFVRAACRYLLHPDFRYNFLGFRCRVQACELEEAVAGGLLAGREGRASAERSEPVAEPGGDSGATSVARAGWINLVDRDSDQIAVPQEPRVRIITDLEELTLCQKPKAKWASAMGRDRFGLWAEFEVPLRSEQMGAVIEGPRSKPGVVTQRLRWIPPGRFMMGSPKGEPGRYDEFEFEPRLQLIERGFWLFDTPVTQALWEAVTGDNPSMFKSPTRPVEQVSWDDCGKFLSELKSLVPDLNLVLPKEVEWEYACRAGTETATYAGPLEILGDAKAPALDPIAWYGGNCGLDFELSNGEKVTWLTNKQYEFDKGGTHPVAMKLPNAWGLYDMLGNVWEWCEDVGCGPNEEAVKPDDASAERVVRGGSWGYFARGVRAAYRYWYQPGNRYYNLGFRCRVQECELKQEPGSVRDSASAERSEPVAEPGGDSGASRGVPHAAK